jgi:hypothetical protein
MLTGWCGCEGSGGDRDARRDEHQLVLRRAVVVTVGHLADPGDETQDGAGVLADDDETGRDAFVVAEQQHELAVSLAESIGGVVQSELEDVTGDTKVVLNPRGAHRLGGESEVTVAGDVAQEAPVLGVGDADDGLTVFFTQSDMHVLVSS